MAETPKSPFTPDESRGSEETVYATEASVREAFAAIGEAAMADKTIQFPKAGEVYEGPFAQITAEHCPLQHLSGNWPEKFIQYVGMIKFMTERPES